MRVLVVSMAGAGHITPLVPLIDAFVDSGDEVLGEHDSSKQESARPK